MKPFNPPKISSAGLNVCAKFLWQLLMKLALFLAVQNKIHSYYFKQII